MDLSEFKEQAKKLHSVHMMARSALELCPKTREVTFADKTQWDMEETSLYSWHSHYYSHTLGQIKANVDLIEEKDDLWLLTDTKDEKFSHRLRMYFKTLKDLKTVLNKQVDELPPGIERNLYSAAVMAIRAEEEMARNIVRNLNLIHENHELKTNDLMVAIPL